MGNGILFAPARNQGRLLGQENPGQRGPKEQSQEKAQGVLQAEQDGLANGLVSFPGKKRGHPGGFLGDVPGAFGRIVSSFLIILIRLYKHGVSPFFPSSCRFYPSCSEYAIVALERHGLFRGLALSAWRIIRCGPWSRGGYDPVPEINQEPELVPGSWFVVPGFLRATSNEERGTTTARGFNEQQATKNEQPA